MRECPPGVQVYPWNIAGSLRAWQFPYRPPGRGARPEKLTLTVRADSEQACWNKRSAGADAADLPGGRDYADNRSVVEYLLTDGRTRGLPVRRIAELAGYSRGLVDKVKRELGLK